MSDSGIELDQGTSGIELDSVALTTGFGSVQRQRIAVSDATAAENNWVIDGTGAGQIAGSVSVLNPSSVASVSVLNTAASIDVGNFPSIFSVSGSVSVLNQSSAATNVTITNAYLPVTQQGNWGASVSNFPATQVVSGTVTADQGTKPWAASVTGTVVANQGNAPWTASVQGQLPVTQATSPWLVSQSGSPWGASVQGTVVSTQGTSPWITSGSVSLNNGHVLVDNSLLAASVQGTVVATEGGTWAVELLDSAGTNKASINSSGALLHAATAASVLPTPATNQGNIALMSDKYGRLVTIPQAPRDMVATTNVPISSTAASVVVPGIAGTYTDISSIVFTNSSSTAVTAVLFDGTNTYHYFVPATDMRGAVYTVPLPATSASVQWTVTTSASVQVVNVTTQYIKNQ